jgi:hypothetical protein
MYQCVHTDKWCYLKHRLIGSSSIKALVKRCTNIFHECGKLGHFFSLELRIDGINVEFIQE